MPEILMELACLPQKQRIRKYYCPYQSGEPDHSIVMYRLLLGLFGLEVFGSASAHFGLKSDIAPGQRRANSENSAARTALRTVKNEGEQGSPPFSLSPQ
jgi:hypothetical protein